MSREGTKTCLESTMLQGGFHNLVGTMTDRAGTMKVYDKALGDKCNIWNLILVWNFKFVMPTFF